jgi:hypothetical protein
VAGTCGYVEELSVSINAENFLTSGKVYWLASQEGLCSMEYIFPYKVRTFLVNHLSGYSAWFNMCLRDGIAVTRSG